MCQAPDILEVRVIKTRCTIEGTMFTQNDVLVRVGRYFDRDPSDPSGLTFEEWTPPAGESSFIFNATELRGINFTMVAADGSPPVQVRRCVRRVGVAAPPPPPPRPKRVCMPKEVDDDIRKRCW